MSSPLDILYEDLKTMTEAEMMDLIRSIRTERSHRAPAATRAKRAAIAGKTTEKAKNLLRSLSPEALAELMGRLKA